VRCEASGVQRAYPPCSAAVMSSGQLEDGRGWEAADTGGSGCALGRGGTIRSCRLSRSESRDSRIRTGFVRSSAVCLVGSRRHHAQRRLHLDECRDEPAQVICREAERSPAQRVLPQGHHHGPLVLVAADPHRATVVAYVGEHITNTWHRIDVSHTYSMHTATADREDHDADPRPVGSRRQRPVPGRRRTRRPPAASVMVYLAGSRDPGP